VQNYRSIIDTGEFEIENLKTILVGPNEAGKTAILQALQKINAPDEVQKFNALRDYPRGNYSAITRKEIELKSIEVVKGVFALDPADLAQAPERLKGLQLEYVFTRKIDNSATHYLSGVSWPAYEDIKKDLIRLTAHLDRNTADGEPKKYSDALEKLVTPSTDPSNYATIAQEILKWLDTILPHIEEDDAKENERWEKLQEECKYAVAFKKFLDYLDHNKPRFVLYSNYFRVKPLIHLGNLAERIRTKVLDDDAYDYGNICLLSLLGFTAQELSDLGRAADPAAGSANLDSYREKLDERSYQLNAASVELTREIVQVWNPNEHKNEASKLRIVADGQYLKVVVEDSIGVEVELDQRSEGFQWLVSFFIVFFAETKGKHDNTILLLDEPGVSLHALKQREFRKTISKLAEANQTIYSTHSPFMVGPDELDLVRVVELTDRSIGTKVHTTVTSSDPAALLPLQEALGYDLAQSLFSSQRNLILEGLTDYWYVEAIAGLLRENDQHILNEKIALIPANTASKVIYFGTILVAQNLKVAALLDSDNAGDQAANQEILVHKLGAKRILRTADYTNPTVPKAEIEDIVRHTLVRIAKSDMGWDIESEAAGEPGRPIIDIFQKKIGSSFSKYKLSKAFLRWARDHNAAELEAGELVNCAKLLTAINNALK
jgi:energy-coupling factor transporter ATP-binding protein EcfA2